MRPPHDVVAVDRPPAAPLERASAVLLDPGGASYGVGEAATVLAEVEDLAVAAKHRRNDARVAGETTCGRRTDGGAGWEPTPRLVEVLDERVVVDRDDDARPLPVDRGQISMGKVVVGELPDGVVTTLSR